MGAWEVWGFEVEVLSWEMDRAVSLGFSISSGQGVQGACYRLTDISP